MTDAVVKVGGSLLAGVTLRPLLAAMGELARSQRLLVVPGGGPFADAVRSACATHDPGDAAAHWMAILAMDQHAHLLAGLLPAARVVSHPEEVAGLQAEGRLPVLAPFAWLRAADPLPHGWHVTSDSIAAWVAAQLGARRLVLLKSVDGVPGKDGDVRDEASPHDAAAAGVVDAYFERALGPGQECWVVGGQDPGRLAALLRDGRARGTRLR